MNFHNIDSAYNKLNLLKNENSILEEKIKNNRAKLNAGDNSVSNEIAIQETQSQALELNISRATKDLGDTINIGVKFSSSLAKEKDEDKILAIVNNDVNKSSVLDLDQLYNNFDSLNGIQKLMLTLLFSSSLILWCLFTIIINLYGNYLLNGFNLEVKYPRLAKIINYRRKLTTYYVISNFLMIVIICLIQIVLSISILSL